MITAYDNHVREWFKQNKNKNKLTASQISKSLTKSQNNTLKLGLVKIKSIELNKKAKVEKEGKVESPAKPSAQTTEFNEKL